MTCVLLKSRVRQTWALYEKGRGDDGRVLYQPPTPFLPLDDAQRAMGLLRQRAAVLGVDPHKIGMVGFSAGGHLVAAISNATRRSYKTVDAAEDDPTDDVRNSSP